MLFTGLPVPLRSFKKSSNIVHARQESLCRLCELTRWRMKKLWGQPKYQRFRDRCQRRQESRRLQNRRSYGEVPNKRNKKARRGKRGIQTLTAPTVFSLVEAPDEMLRFLKNLRSYLFLRNIHVKIELEEVTTIDPESVAVFVAIIESIPKGRVSRVSGTVPRDPICARRLHDFGFFQHVKGGLNLGVPAGTIRKLHKGTKVEGNTANDIIKFGLERLNEKTSKHGPTYNIFTEAMGNTFQHASQKIKRDEQTERCRWWASAYHDDTKKSVCFTVVDLGIGILKSFNFRQNWKAALQRFTIHQSDGKKLNLLLDGKIPSRTGVKYRGRGLPNMKEACVQHRISNLLILSNRAFAHVEKGTYKTLSVGFGGTIIYWEVSGSNKAHP